VTLTAIKKQLGEYCVKCVMESEKI
jgi:hypothetical protein